jgi:hypothetical protein
VTLQLHDLRSHPCVALHAAWRDPPASVAASPGGGSGGGGGSGEPPWAPRRARSLAARRPGRSSLQTGLARYEVVPRCVVRCVCDRGSSCHARTARSDVCVSHTNCHVRWSSDLVSSERARALCLWLMQMGRSHHPLPCPRLPPPRARARLTSKRCLRGERLPAARPRARSTESSCSLGTAKGP